MDYRGDRIRISDFVLEDGMVIEGHTFENCTLVGPAILWLDQDTPNKIEFSVFPHELDKIIWEVPSSRPAFVGVVVVRNCSFTSCKFLGIGFAGYEGLRAKFRSFDLAV